jgi:C4-dicarboxylate-specific signal transduction histidine kinase
LTSEEIESELGHANELIDTLSQGIQEIINAKTDDMAFSTFSTAELFEELRTYAETKFPGQPTRFLLAGDAIREITTSRYHLMMVITKLLDNAYEAIIEQKAQNGLITLDFRQNDQDRYLVTLTDNGGGFDDTVAARLFQPYVSTKSFNGRGMGLYLSKVTTEQILNGTIACSNSREGAQCRIAIPHPEQE